MYTNRSVLHHARNRNKRSHLCMDRSTFRRVQLLLITFDANYIRRAIKLQNLVGVNAF